MDDLSPSELAEYERQRKELEHDRYHDYGKCGMPLIVYVHIKEKELPKGIRRAKITKQFCQVHKVWVWLNGWEIGFSLGEDSRIN